MSQQQDSQNDTFSSLQSLTKDADCVLVCREGVEVKVHSLMLRLYSPVLADMLEHCSSGLSRQAQPAAHPMRISVPDDDANAWHTLLQQHLYLANFTDLSPYKSYSDLVEKLVLLADKYDMQAVLEAAEVHILQQVPTTANRPHKFVEALNWMRLSDKVNMKRAFRSFSLHVQECLRCCRGQSGLQLQDLFKPDYLKDLALQNPRVAADLLSYLFGVHFPHAQRNHGT